MINKFLLSVPPATGGVNNYLYRWGTGSPASLLGTGVTTTPFENSNTVVQTSSPVQIGADGWAEISVTSSFALGIKKDGSLWAWGDNSYGQLAYEDGNSWTKVAHSRSHGHGIRVDGTLWGWGYTIFTGIAWTPTETTRVRQSPSQIAGGGSWTQVACVNQGGLGIKSDGTLWGWGNPSQGVLGLGNGVTTNVSSPVQIGTSSWLLVNAADNSVIGLRSDGTLWGWGERTFAQFFTESSDTTSWAKLTASDITPFAIRNDGTLWAWGYNSTDGVAGSNSTTVSFRSAIQVAGGGSWTKVVSGSYGTGAQHVAAIKTDGTLWVWGSNTYGELGLGTASSVNISSPVQVSVGTSWVDVAVGGDHTIAIKSDGTLWAWGRNQSGQLGDGSTLNRSAPFQIGTLTSWTKVAAGISHSMAIYANDVITNPAAPVTSLWTWGGNGFGQLGLGIASSISRSSPVQVGSTADSWTMIYSGSRECAAIKANGTLWLWGNNFNGSLGLNTPSNTHRSSPVQITGGGSWSKVSVGNEWMAGLRTDGTLWTWGANDYGQLAIGGSGTINGNRSSPVQIRSDVTWSDIGTTRYTLLALSSSGQMYTSGHNIYGELLQPGLTYNLNIQNTVRLQRVHVIDTGYVSSPVQIDVGGSWTYVNSNGYHVAAIKADGSLWTWGMGIGGRLGDDVQSTVISPIKVGNSSWSKVAAGANATIAVRSDGTLWTWGSNIGTGVTTLRSSPVQIGVGNTWKDVYVNNGGYSFSTDPSGYWAISSDSTLWSWNFQYPGDGTSSAKTTPTQVSNQSWSMISTSSSTSSVVFASGIRADGTLMWWGINTAAGMPSGGYGNSPAMAVPQKAFSCLYLTTPTRIGTSSWTKVSTNTYGAVGAIRSDGTLWTWGRNAPGTLASEAGILGNNSTVHCFSPTQIGTSSWKQIALGDITAHAIRSDGILFGWGGGTTGRVGDGLVQGRSSPVQIGTSSWIMIGTSGDASFKLALRTDNTLWGWGSSGNGQLPTELFTLASAVSRSSPVQIGGTAGTSDWIYCAVGSTGGGAFAIKTNGSLWAWGRSTSGSLGLTFAQTGGATSVSSPMQVGNTTWSWTMVAGGETDAGFAIRTDGTLWGWGITSRLCVSPPGGLTAVSSPIQIGIGKSWVMVDGGSFISMGISSE